MFRFNPPRLSTRAKSCKGIKHTWTHRRNGIVRVSKKRMKTSPRSSKELAGFAEGGVAQG